VVLVSVALTQISDVVLNVWPPVQFPGGGAGGSGGGSGGGDGGLGGGGGAGGGAGEGGGLPR